MEDQSNIAAENNGDHEIDEAMLELREFVAQMTDVEGYLIDMDMLTATRIEKLKLSMPMQLDLHVMDDGSVRLGGSPPLYYTETTILPVFHQLNVQLEINGQEDNHSDDHEQAVEPGIIH